MTANDGSSQPTLWAMKFKIGQGKKKQKKTKKHVGKNTKTWYFEETMC